VVLFVVLCVLLMLCAPAAIADTPREQLERARQRLDTLSRDLEIQIEECNLRREQLKTAKQAVKENRAKYDETAAQLAAVADERSQVAAQMYKERTAGRQVSAVTGSITDLNDYAERMAWLDITRQARTTAFERYASTRTTLAASSDLLETAKQQAAETNADAQRSCDATRRRVASQEERIADLSAEVERLAAAARRRAARRDAASAPAAPPSDAAPVAAPKVSGRAQAAVNFALAQVGKPYGWGGSGPGSYDCSGLMMASWAAAGVSLPHSSAMQYGATRRVSRDQLQPGDILFFGSPIHHDAMYVGNGQMVEAPHTGLNVRVVSMDRSDYVGAGRP
jgi:cell wall-associated NlpC family hydrolase